MDIRTDLYKEYTCSMNAMHIYEAMYSGYYILWITDKMDGTEHNLFTHIMYYFVIHQLWQSPGFWTVCYVTTPQPWHNTDKLIS